MSEQLDTLDWKHFRHELQEMKANRRDELTNVVEHFCVDNRINLVKLTPYHFRLSLSGFNKIDVFPTSSSIRLLVKGAKSKRVDLYKWLKKYYNV